MSHEPGNINGCQHKQPGIVAKRMRQKAAWERCPDHEYKKGNCTSCGHPEQEDTR